ncbi:MAG: NAD-dependent epimerase [Candidatus Omnitrophota bacterium]
MENVTLDCRNDAEKEMKIILVTGAAGFIGFHFVQRLCSEYDRIIGVDNISPYYDINLKYARLAQLGFNREEIETNEETKPAVSTLHPGLVFYRMDLKDKNPLDRIFKTETPDHVVHLAAQAGVRYSIENPYAYIDSNIMGLMNILENCRHHPVKHLVFASSSSVYGANRALPYAEHQPTDHPVSLYAATKKSNELMAHTYAHLFKIPCTGLRFFTVYGPWGRPDMAYFDFTRRIVHDIPIDIFNNGHMKRDFTYIDDIVEGIVRVVLKTPEPNPAWDPLHPDPASSDAPYRLFNIGNHQPVDLLYFIDLLEKYLGKKAIKHFLPLQQGDVLETFADIDALNAYTGFMPHTPIETGIAHFVKWYNDYNKGNHGTSTQ